MNLSLRKVWTTCKDRCLLRSQIYKLCICQYFKIPITSSVCIPQALGMESGAIPNSQLRASSQRNHASGPSRGRLNVKESNTLVGAWVSLSDNLNQWLQIDLGNHNTNFTHVATQGRNAFSTRWVTKYNLEFSDDGVNFQYYKEKRQVINKVK